jgi:transposase
MIMRYELADYEWTAIEPMLPNKPRGIPRVKDRRVLNGISGCCGPERHGVTCPKTSGPIEHGRRVATRYDRLAANYLAFAHLASIRLWLRVNEPVPVRVRSRIRLGSK